MSEGQAAQDERREQSHDIPPAEWAAAAIGLLIILAVLGSLIFEATRGSSPPHIGIAVVGVDAQKGGYLVRLRVINTGGSTAAQLVIEGALTPPKSEVQRSQITVDYVPARSERGAGLFFTSDPSKGQLDVRPIGYQEP